MSFACSKPLEQCNATCKLELYPQAPEVQACHRVEYDNTSSSHSPASGVGMSNVNFHMTTDTNLGFASGGAGTDSDLGTSVLSPDDNQAQMDISAGNSDSGENIGIRVSRTPDVPLKYPTPTLTTLTTSATLPNLASGYIKLPESPIPSNQETAKVSRAGIPVSGSPDEPVSALQSSPVFRTNAHCLHRKTASLDLRDDFVHAAQHSGSGDVQRVDHGPNYEHDNNYDNDGNEHKFNPTNGRVHSSVVCGNVNLQAQWSTSIPHVGDSGEGRNSPD